MFEEFEGRVICVKLIMVLEILVRRFVDDFHDEVLA